MKLIKFSYLDINPKFIVRIEHFFDNDISWIAVTLSDGDRIKRDFHDIESAKEYYCKLLDELAEVEA